MREAYSATALASLEWDENREKAIDRIAASGKCDPLGIAFWKARYMLEASAYQDARAGLIRVYKERYQREEHSLIVRVIEQCLHEYLSPFCQDCLGAREVVMDELKVVCPACEGSGLKAYSDEERARTMQISLARTRQLGFKFAWILGLITVMDKEVNAVMVEQLERGLYK